MKMNVIFQDSEEKYLSNVILYAKDTSDGYVYADAEQTQTVNRETLLNLCMKGLVLVLYNGVYYKPAFFKDSSGTVTITIITNIGASDSASLELKSKEAEE